MATVIPNTQVFDMPRSRYAMAEEDSQYSPWYVGWANCDREAADVLRDYYERPLFLPEDSREGQDIQCLHGVKMLDFKSYEGSMAP